MTCHVWYRNCCVWYRGCHVWRKAAKPCDSWKFVALSRCHVKKQTNQMKGEITVKNYRRNRTETLSLRLTAEEKQVLKALAEKRNLSMTDYILLSGLHYSAGEHYRHALKTLKQIRTELLALQKSNPGDAVSDALEKQMQLYDAVLAAIRCT